MIEHKGLNDKEVEESRKNMVLMPFQTLNQPRCGRNFWRHLRIQ